MIDRTAELRDRLTLLELERNALIAYVAGTGQPAQRALIQAECEARWRDGDLDGADREEKEQTK